MSSPDFTLSSAQTEAVQYEGNSLLILAGPGTGKTRVLISRIEHFLKIGIPPEKILAVTFSRKATAEMEDRLLQSRPDLSGRLSIQTLHSVCLDLVQRHGFRLGLPTKTRLMTTAQATLLFREIASELPLDRFAKSSQIDGVLSEYLSLFQRAKDAGIWPEDFIHYAQELPQNSEEEISKHLDWLAHGDVYNSFQNYCLKEGWLDFGDAILFATRLLADFPDVRKQVQSEYDAILVDEFQDTNWSQIQLVRHMASPDCRVTAVGDDDQSIYQFRGASYSAFRFFEEAFPQTKVVELVETYRLPPSVVEAASQSILQNGEKRYRADKKIRALRNETQKVKVIISTQYEQEAQWICEEIASLLKAGVSPKEIGILVRSHSHAELICAEAAHRKIPLRSKSTEALFDREIIRDLMAYLRLLQNPEDNVSFLRLLDSPFIGLEADEIYSVCRWAKKGGGSYIDRLGELPELLLKTESAQRLKSFQSLHQIHCVSSLREPITQLLFSIFESTGIVKNLFRQDLSSLRDLANFSTQLKSWESIQSEKTLPALFPLLESISRRELQLQEEEVLGSSLVDEVQVLSVHASKGLEFDYVFMPSLVGRRFPGLFRSEAWPLPDSLQKEEAASKDTHLHEERRLFYVGITRTKKQLYLSAISKKGTKPSVFLSGDLQNFKKNPELCEWIELPTFDESQWMHQLERKPFGRIRETLAPVTKSEDGLRLSFTQLDKYEDCPRKYWFAYDLGIPLPEGNALVMGSLVHSCLEKFFLHWMLHREATIEETLKFYDQEFEKLKKSNPQLLDRDFHLGRKGLQEYFEAEGPKFPTPLAIEKSFNLQIGKHSLSGKIDRVDQLNDGSVRIVDYKTGKAKEDGNETHEKFAKDSLQFSIYALAAKECFDWKVNEMSFHYVYANKKLHTQREESDLELTKTRIEAIASKIQSREFDPTPGFGCQFCEYRELCPDAL
jgi:DNA helicase-2/ATP-dependent DNA helicase PcrA